MPNNSFETLQKPCDFAMRISSLTSWVSDWFIINSGTVEYLNACANALNYPTSSTVPLNCKGYQLAQKMMLM